MASIKNFNYLLITAISIYLTGCGSGTPTSTVTSYSNNPQPGTPTTQLPTGTDTNNNHQTTLGQSNSKQTIGPRKVASTPLEKATLFASPDGTGTGLVKDDPASLGTAISKLKAGDVLFLRGGVYDVSNTLLSLRKNSGTADAPIIIESYPGERAVLDGGGKGKITSGIYAGDPVGLRINHGADHIYIRKIDFTNFYKQALVITSSYNVVEGCRFYNNKYVALQLTSNSFDNNSGKWSSGHNILRDNIVHDNSDAGIVDGSHKNGGNSDGISVSAGDYNKVLHNLVYHNSDDGIDTWRSNDTEVAYNIVHDHGIANGDGGGIKLGGNLDRSIKNGMRAYCHHNISYNNKKYGYNLNAGRDVRIEYNTSYNNQGREGYANLVDGDVILKNNISYKDNLPVWNDNGTQIDNSWQLDEPLEFISTDPASKDFLKPKNSSLSNTLGAFAQISE